MLVLVLAVAVVVAVVQGDDAPAVYDLFSIVSHLGPTATSGHYVCHILKDGAWTLFNDSKVCVYARVSCSRCLLSHLASSTTVCMCHRVTGGVL